jgi:hypothetical protein
MAPHDVLAAEALRRFDMTISVVLVLLGLGVGVIFTYLVKMGRNKLIRWMFTLVTLLVKRQTRMRKKHKKKKKRNDPLSERLTHQERLLRSERACSAHFLLTIAVRLLPPSERDRYLEEFRAELLDVPRNTRLSHALSLLCGVFLLRLRRGLKNKADAAVRSAKG